MAIERLFFTKFFSDRFQKQMNTRSLVWGFVPQCGIFILFTTQVGVAYMVAVVGWGLDDASIPQREWKHTKTVGRMHTGASVQMKYTGGQLCDWIQEEVSSTIPLCSRVFEEVQSMIVLYLLYWISSWLHGTHSEEHVWREHLWEMLFYHRIHPSLKRFCKDLARL